MPKYINEKNIIFHRNIIFLKKQKKRIKIQKNGFNGFNEKTEKTANPDK